MCQNWLPRGGESPRKSFSNVFFSLGRLLVPRVSPGSPQAGPRTHLSLFSTRIGVPRGTFFNIVGTLVRGGKKTRALRHVFRPVGALFLQADYALVITSAVAGLGAARWIYTSADPCISMHCEVEQSKRSRVQWCPSTNVVFEQLFRAVASNRDCERMLM